MTVINEAKIMTYNAAIVLCCRVYVYVWVGIETSIPMIAEPCPWLGWWGQNREDIVTMRRPSQPLKKT